MINKRDQAIRSGDEVSVGLGPCSLTQSVRERKESFGGVAECVSINSWRQEFRPSRGE